MWAADCRHYRQEQKRRWKQLLLMTEGTADCRSCLWLCQRLIKLAEGLTSRARWAKTAPVKIQQNAKLQNLGVREAPTPLLLLFPSHHSFIYLFIYLFPFLPASALKYSCLPPLTYSAAILRSIYTSAANKAALLADCKMRKRGLSRVSSFLFFGFFFSA